MPKTNRIIAVTIVILAWTLLFVFGMGIVKMAPTPRDVTGGNALHIACSDATSVRDAVKAAADAPADTGQHEELRDWGLNPAKDDRLPAVMSQLDKLVNDCSAHK